ncbi:hypothetical protein RvY_06278 [Ramazzottius varieornatus]|uniref:Uncharacterized protein n=1 Tax=Ramazzottius varieornatus TaxID=947166 RepID=A0A1D1V4E4_RAMVA|nr:hypothetical protein RvY_06278 [Ramazzottius varieornatus]
MHLCENRQPMTGRPFCVVLDRLAFHFRSSFRLFPERWYDVSGFSFLSAESRMICLPVGRFYKKNVREIGRLTDCLNWTDIPNF